MNRKKKIRLKRRAPSLVHSVVSRSLSQSPVPRIKRKIIANMSASKIVLTVINYTFYFIIIIFVHSIERLRVF